MKNARHEEILKLIGEYDIETQEELAEKLQERGFPVTQATVSRDIRQLLLTKLPGKSGRPVYKSSEETGSEGSRRFRQIMRTAFVSMDSASNMLVIHTVAGMAMAACAALDAFDWPELLGTIGGDDTIFAVIRTEEECAVIMKRIEALIGS